MWIFGLAALWGFQFLHAVFGGWRGAKQVSLAKFLMIGPLVFLSSWWLLTPVLALTVWVFWLGDGDHWFWDSAHVVSGVVAAVFALLVLGRLILTPSNHRYANVQLAMSIVCMMAIGMVRISDMLSRVDGWTAEAAVKNIVHSNPGFEEAKIELDSSTSDSRQFRVRLDGEQRATISVVRVFFDLGWGQSSSSWVGTAEDDLTDLRDRAARMHHYQNPINLRDSLELFIQDHPDTPESEEVKHWLAEVEIEVGRIEKAQELGGRPDLLMRLPRLMRERAGKPVDLTRQQQIAVQVYRLIDVESLVIYYQGSTCEHRDEAAAALREVGANEAADWLTDANRRLEPYLDESGMRIRADAREDGFRAMRTLRHTGEFADDIINRLILYCDANPGHFPTLGELRDEDLQSFGEEHPQ